MLSAGSRRNPRLLSLLATLLMLGALSGAEAGPAEAAKYSVAQCGWGINREADWAESASLRFNHSALCVPPGSDIWAGVQMRTYTRPAAGSAAATTLGRWRWVAPSGTAITNVRGSWWHRLYDGFQHRLGGISPSGSFDLKFASSSNQAMTAFAAGFSPGVSTFESRLLCARASGKRCDTSPSSEAMVRSLNITLEENSAPQPGSGGPAVESGGWLRGNTQVNYSATDQGAGIRFADLLIDGAHMQRVEHICNKALIGGEWRGTMMRPCALQAGGANPIATTSLSDGHHHLQHCVEDFAGNRGCGAHRGFAVDNNPPAAPKGLSLTRGSGWSRHSEFALRWSNPSQGAGSPIIAAGYRIQGGEGHDSGVVVRAGNGIAALDGLAVPRAGSYTATVWLRDQAGNESASNAATVPIQFDDVAPQAAFRGFNDPERPELLRARVRDAHSGPAAGTVFYRRSGTGEWTKLPTEIEATEVPGEADLVARFPSDQVEPATYEFRARAQDGAGNATETTQRLDGQSMSVWAPVKQSTRLIARLETVRTSGRRVVAGFGEVATVSGQLIRGASTPLAGQELRLIQSPSAGARAGARVDTAITDASGNFSFPLGPTSSRRIEIRFAGTDRLAAARAPDLDLRVQGSAILRAAKRKVVTGEVLKLRGRVRTRDAWVPARGKLIAIQYFERRAKRWRPVAFTRTDRRGAFKTRYRFRYTTKPSRVKLRAVALPEARWPYASGPSAAMPIRVKPRPRINKKSRRVSRTKAGSRSRANGGRAKRR